MVYEPLATLYPVLMVRFVLYRVIFSEPARFLVSSELFTRPFTGL